MRRLLVLLTSLVMLFSVLTGTASVSNAATPSSSQASVQQRASVAKVKIEKAKKKKKKKKTKLLPRPADSSPRAHDRSKPHAGNTGVPGGTSLRVHQGDLTITKAGTVIDGLDIRGFVTIKAPRVVIRRSIIRGSAGGPSFSRGLIAITTKAARGYLVEDVTLAPQNSHPNIDGIKVNQAGMLRRLDISRTVDGILVYGHGVRVERSFLHDFAHFESDPQQGGGASHDDAIQVQAGLDVRIVRNTLRGAYNAAVMVTQDAGTTRRLWIIDNWIDGGGCSINYKSNGAYKRGMRADNNRFGRATRVPGCAIIHNQSRSDLTPRGNVWEDNGTQARVRIGQ